ncbi:hypothetical protein [Streptomyces decoyicus]|nr:hypothetical protein [Streptomyces decoyicus]QZY15864.1 hypothetical protein K7C20_11800 [Streptomyces decoyicus]
MGIPTPPAGLHHHDEGTPAPPGYTPSPGASGSFADAVSPERTNATV